MSDIDILPIPVPFFRTGWDLKRISVSLNLAFSWQKIPVMLKINDINGTVIGNDRTIFFILVNLIQTLLIVLIFYQTLLITLNLCNTN